MNIAFFDRHQITWTLPCLIYRGTQNQEEIRREAIEEIETETEEIVMEEGEDTTIEMVTLREPSHTKVRLDITLSHHPILTLFTDDGSIRTKRGRGLREVDGSLAIDQKDGR